MAALEVLVVEDSRFFTTVLKKGVEERLGFQVTQAATRKEALKLLEAGSARFFAALVDLQLPDSADGEVVDDVIRHKIPTIVFTGSFSDELRETILSKNIVDYISKSSPSCFEQILYILRRLAINGATSVLIVDDSRVSRLQIGALLKAHRFKVFEATTGAEALSLLATQPDIRLVITDYNMKGMDGCALTEQIRRGQSRDKIAIIGLSAYGNNILSARFMKSGASDYVNKPFIPEELFCRIYQNLELIEKIESAHRVGLGLANGSLRRSEEGAEGFNPIIHDTVTGLPNRRLFADRLDMAIASARRFSYRAALILIDLDLFKRINDALGYALGDKALIEVAKRLGSGLADGDTLARIGADEFTIIIHNIKSEGEVAKFAKKLLSVIQSVIEIDGQQLFLTASIGIALFPEDGADVEALVKASEIAMYRAKDLGRNNAQLYTPAMNVRSMQLLSLEGALRRALTKNEFRLVYQGKIDLADGTLCGVEALIRWEDPEHGTVNPADFIPLAESLGLISDIGMWVLLEACRQVAAWRAAGLPQIPISVNVSPRQFRDQNVARLVARILRKYDISPGILELEITESLLMQHFEEAARALSDLRAMGVKVSIDDFGTGYSSLSYLSRIPIDSLKIDRSFIANLARSADDDEIVSSIIGLAHNLKLSAVAEGVETIEQAIFLNERGCDQVQGYLVARPMKPEDLVGLFHRKLLILPARPK